MTLLKIRPDRTKAARGTTAKRPGMTFVATVRVMANKKTPRNLPARKPGRPKGAVTSELEARITALEDRK